MQLVLNDILDASLDHHQISLFGAKTAHYIKPHNNKSSKFMIFRECVPQNS